MKYRKDSFHGGPRWLCLSLILLLGCLSASAQAPTNNPVLDYYAGDEQLADYQWTNDLPWDRVFDIRDFGGVADGNAVGDGVGVTDNSDAFQAAVDAAWRSGGGVVYLPAGTWYFGDHLYLRSGVVVRGATPTVQDALEDDFAPPTKLEFPRYFFDKTANGGTGNPNDSAFKFVYVDNSEPASNIGMVWLDINRAGIVMSDDGQGTTNRLVFGTRTNNVSSPAPDVPRTTLTIDDEEIPFQKEWQRFTWRFTRNIHVFGQENVLVANNRCNDRHYVVENELPGHETTVIDDFVQPGYVIEDTKNAFINQRDENRLVALGGEYRPIFRYTDHYGIHVRGGTGTWGAAPWEGTSLFRPNTTVRDNWVYTTMRVGYHLSGYGLKVLNNVKRDLSDKPWWLHPTGRQSISGAQTLENRGLDVGGSQILIQGNDFQVYRHRINNGGYLSTDGEGILVQECCGGTTLDGLYIRDNTVNAYIGIYKIPYTRDIQITGNTLSEAGYIMVDADKNGSRGPVFNVLVENNTFTNNKGIIVRGTSGGGDVVILENTLNGGNILYPDSITTLSGNTGMGSTEALTVDGVRDYPLLTVLDPAPGSDLDSGDTVTVEAVVEGSFLNPDPASQNELPDLSLVEIYANSTLLASFTDATAAYHETTNSFRFTVDWTPDGGLYQLAAKAVPTGYSDPVSSTEWFTVSNVVHVRVHPQSYFPDWQATHFPGETDPAIISEAANPDGDPYSNLLEFIMGSDPMTPNEPDDLMLQSDETNLSFLFPMRQQPGEDVSMEILQSNDLRNWSSVPIENTSPAADQNGLPDGVERRQWSLPIPDSEGAFIQLKAIRVP